MEKLPLQNKTLKMSWKPVFLGEKSQPPRALRADRNPGQEEFGVGV